MSKSKGIFRWITLLFSVALVCAVAGPQARASEWNEKTQLTFNEPVEIPGRVLPAGTYTFQLMNLPSNRNVVEIFNKNRTKLDAVVMAIPAYRETPTGKTVVTFAERPVNTPEAVHTWFYPGTQFGQEFLYQNPSPRRELAMAARTKASRAG